MDMLLKALQHHRALRRRRVSRQGEAQDVASGGQDKGVEGAAGVDGLVVPGDAAVAKRVITQVEPLQIREQRGGAREERRQQRGMTTRGTETWTRPSVGSL